MTSSLVFSRSGESPSGMSPGRWTLWCVNANGDSGKSVHRRDGRTIVWWRVKYVISLRSDFATLPSKAGPRPDKARNIPVEQVVDLSTQWLDVRRRLALDGIKRVTQCTKSRSYVCIGWYAAPRANLLLRHGRRDAGV